MNGRNDDKEQLRRARLEAERTDAASARRGSIVGYAVAAALVLALAGAIVLASTGGGSSSSKASDDPFGQHYQGLEQRRTAASVPTMMDTMNSSVHIHPTIAVYIDGAQTEVPPNIGIDPSQPGMQMAGLHTHDSSGTIHDEGMPGARLGQFFEIWGVPFSKNQLGLYRASAIKQVRMWVDGKPSTAFGDLLLADGQKIVVAYGTGEQTPPGITP